jgi:hypothetical protein
LAPEMFPEMAEGGARVSLTLGGATNGVLDE